MMTTKLRDILVGLAGLISSVLAIVAFVTGNQSLNDFLPTSTAPLTVERIVTATPAAFTGASFTSGAENAPAAPTQPSAAERCGLLVPRLVAGGRGRVYSSPNENNRVRSEPGLAGQQVGIIPAGERFSVVEGPRCIDNIIWWYVRYGGLQGWTAEGLGDRYFVEPA